MKKMSRLWFKQPLLAAFTALAVLLALSAAPALAAEKTTGAPSAEKEPEAMAILLKMANFLAKAPAFSVTQRSGYDAIQSDGERIEFGEKRRMLLQRPDRVRVEVQRSDGDKGLVLFDGKGITAYKADDNVYARAEIPSNVDDVLVYLVKNLNMTLPMARMFQTSFPEYLEKQITSVDYVEEDYLFDVPTDHLAARSAEVDLQIWIAQGKQPLPRRIIITYKNAPGEPQFRADLSDWDLSPKMAANAFTFKPPKGAEQIPFLVPERRKGSLPMEKGEEQ